MCAFFRIVSAWIGAFCEDDPPDVLVIAVASEPTTAAANTTTAIPRAMGLACFAAAGRSLFMVTSLGS
jgi:hypothetical protein